MISNLLLASSLIANTIAIDTTLAPPVELESITIISSREDNAHKSGTELVLKSSDLQRFEVVDPNTQLQGQPGVFTQQEDGWGLRLNIGIRGTGVLRSSRITLMEDGVLTAPAPYSAPAAYYSPVLWKYDQIEILKGSAALIAGPQSTGGAINFVLPSPSNKDYYRIKLSGGSFGMLSQSLQGQSTLSKKAQLIYGFQNRSAGGFATIGDERTGGFSLFDGYIKYIQHLDANDRHHLSVYVGGTRERSAQTYLGTSFEDATAAPSMRYFASIRDSMMMDRNMVKVGYTYNSKKGWFRADMYRQFVHRNWYKLDKIDAGSGATSIASILENTSGYASEFLALQGLMSDTAAAILKANNRYYINTGIQLRGQWTQRFEQTYLKHEAGLRIHRDEADRFQHSDAYGMYDGEYWMTQPGEAGGAGNRIDYASAQSGYYRTTLNQRGFDIQAGVRIENILAGRTDFGSNDPDRLGTALNERQNGTLSILPGASISKQIGLWKTYAGVHRGMTPGGSKEGVLPETSTTLEFGANHSTRPLSIAMYHSAYDRLLGSDAASSGGSGTGELYNGGAATIAGLELEAGGSRGKFQYALSGSYTSAVFNEAFKSEFEGWGDVEAGDILPYIPALQGTIKLGYSLEKTGLFTQATALSARKSAASLEEYDLPASVVVNGGIEHLFSEKIQLKIAAQNLTNTRHIVAARPAGFRTFAPRMIVVGINLNL
jgi:Fe(3+) dicitrate transport protein